MALQVENVIVFKIQEKKRKLQRKNLICGHVAQNRKFQSFYNIISDSLVTLSKLSYRKLLPP